MMKRMSSEECSVNNEQLIVKSLDNPYLDIKVRQLFVGIRIQVISFLNKGSIKSR
jgi:hypothetical protein